MNRRQFLVGSAGLVARSGVSHSTRPEVSIIREPASAAPVTWAVGELLNALQAGGLSARVFDRIEQAPESGFCILAVGPGNPSAAEILERARLSLPRLAESLALAEGRLGNRRVLLCSGGDARGLSYALLELADRVIHSRDLMDALVIRKPVVEKPANPIRSNMRLFVSEVEDKPWYYDRSFWERYLSMLTAQRFNRFHLAFGIGYDFLGEVRDSYFHFAYPFLLDVPGYKVRAVGLPDSERDRNLEMLRFISETAAARGIHFQLGLWTHGYDWAKNPGVNYVIEGLTPDNHALYCRDALTSLLRACPAIGGVTFRIHGESGIPEGTYAFWKTVFEGIVRSERRVEIDMHAKGIDQAMIDVALATRMPVNVSPKFWAEHMGLPYQQAAIRSLEMPPEGKQDEGFFAKSSGSRRFMRYGYGDRLKEDRKYGVYFRMWPGTQRLLLWGDPETAAAYSRASGFCGCLGLDLFEPLSFKGRKGSGIPAGRDGYADSSLRPKGGDWEKYLYPYRLWGRLLYNPDADPGTWRRFLSKEYGPQAGYAENAMAHASRILPLITTAHDPSAANNSYWPEMYTNMPIVDASRPHPYGDTPASKRFGAVSPLDTEIFSSVDECAEELLRGRLGPRYSPSEVADWLERLAASAAVKRGARGMDSPACRRMTIDIEIQAGLGRFFASKLRAAVLYALFERTGDPTAIQEALNQYRGARKAWAELSAKAH